MIFLDRAKETSTDTGVGSLALAGAAAGYQALPSDVFYYCIVNTEADEWEVGSGSKSTGSLTRSTVLDSSDSGSKVSFSAGTKEVFCTMPAAMINGLQPSGLAGGMTFDDTPTDITVDLFPSPPSVGGIRFLYATYSVLAHTPSTGEIKAWTGMLVYEGGVGATDTPTAIYDPDTTGWVVAADIDSDELVFTVTGDAANDTYWKITVRVEMAEENGV